MADSVENNEQPETNVQLDNAIRALHQKKPAPEIDFTLHTMEDGTQVSTLDRVCKGQSSVVIFSCFEQDAAAAMPRLASSGAL